jgi:uncharacterized Zn finger protein (UPF0148 family)
MSEIYECPNCGGALKNDGVKTYCPYCRRVLSDKTEDLKKEEINRLVDMNVSWDEQIDSQSVIHGKVKEPREGILTDDEILKYAPKSKSAAKIRINKGNYSVSDKVRIHEWFIMAMIYIIFVGGMLGVIAGILFVGVIGMLIALILFVILPVVGIIKKLGYV